MRFTRSLISVAALCLASASAFSADWQTTYYGTSKGAYFIDKDSLIDANGGFKKFWTLYAPRVQAGQPGEGYAYVKHLTGINCKTREAMRYESIYTDEGGADHSAEVKLEKNPYTIVPNSEEDYWWAYLCKAKTAKEQAELAVAQSDSAMKKYLADQISFTRENSIRYKRANGQ